MKKILLSLFVLLIGFINFGFCADVIITDGFEETYSTTNAFYNDLYGTNTDNIYKFCINNNSNNEIDVWYGVYELKLIGGYNYPVCFALDNSFESLSVITSNEYSVYTVEFMQISYFNSLNCQTEYNLIPISSVDQNYCIENQLCPNNSGTGNFSGDLQFSNIYINDILHPGKQNIFVNIPDYIMWDYNVVGDDFNIYVGSGYDVDYINSVIDINSYRPTSSDFTNVFVGGLTLIFPYIVIVLFIVFIRKLIKRIFK